MPEVVESFTTPGGTTWELRESSRGNRYAVASNRDNKQPVDSYQAAKAGSESARSRQARGTSQPGEEPDYLAGFEEEKIDADDRNRTTPYDELLQLTRPVGATLEAFRSALEEYAAMMASAHEDVIERAPDEYWTHANWGAEIKWMFDDAPDVSTESNTGAVSTKDVHAENVRTDDFPEVYHYRHFPSIDGRSTDPGLVERFIATIGNLRDDSPTEIIVESVWIEFVQYPPEETMSKRLTYEPERRAPTVGDAKDDPRRYVCPDCGSHKVIERVDDPRRSEPDKGYYCYGCKSVIEAVYDKKTETEEDDIDA